VPAGASYEIWLYEEGNCGAPIAGSGGSPPVIEQVWPDTQALDDRDFAVEVRHLSGTCDAANPWLLTIESF
jgi:hypothetical protein